jgi:hypothetical protein
MRRLGHGVAAGLILLTVGVLYRRLLWPWGHPIDRLHSDFSLQFYPWLYHSTRSLFSGHIPWWTDLVGSGVPFVAALETGAFFPEHLLLGLVTGGRPSFLAGQTYQVFNIGLSGVGAYLLARELGAGWLGGLVAGVLWAVTGDLADYLVYVDRIDALTCLPFLLLLGHRALRRRSPVALVGTALVLAADLMSGHLQWALMHTYALILLSVFWVAPSVGLSPRRWTWPLVALGLVIVCGTLVAMPTLLPAWEFFPLTSRHDYFSPQEATALAAGWNHLVGGNPFGRGGLFLMLAASAVALRRDRTVWGLATLAVLAFLLALGDTGLLYPLAVRVVPGIGRFRFAVRFFHLAALGAALLAGLALDRLWRRDARVASSGRAMLGVVTLASPWLRMGAPTWSLAQGVGLLAAAWLGPRVAWRRAVLLILVGSAVAVPVYTVRYTNSVAQQEDFFFTDPRIPWFQAQPGLWRITNAGALITHAQAKDFWDYHRWQFQGSYLTGIPTWSSGGTLHLQAFDTFVVQTTWYGRLYDLLNIRYMPEGQDPPPPVQGKYEPWDLAPGSRWQIDLMGLAPHDGVVDLTLNGRDLEVDVERGGRKVSATARDGAVHVAELPEGRLLTLVVRTGRGRVTSVRVGGREILGAAPRWSLVRPGIWENAHALPRAFIADGYEVHPDRAVLLQALPGLEPALSVVLEEEPRFTAAGKAVAAPGAEVVRYAPGDVEIVARLTRPGFLVLTDTFYPGWRAEVDGQRVRLLRADYVFRAVALGAGEHRVVFRYRPWWRVWVWVLSVGGLGLAVGLAPAVCRRLPPLGDVDTPSMERCGQ